MRLDLLRALHLRAVLGAVLFAFSTGVVSATEPSPAHRQRADKIVATLGVTDVAKAARVSDAIAAHYANVNAIHDATGAELKRLKAQPAADKDAAAAAAKAVREAATPKLAELHAAFLAQLNADLTPAQVDQVKDGMTFGVVPLTFRVYQELLPNLTAEQKAQIHAWLVEAREHAVDAGSAEEKHAWFGKYKGRINNYLAKAGYDMKQAEREMLARQKAAKSHAEK